jgi:hypothetical protein
MGRFAFKNVACLACGYEEAVGDGDAVALAIAHLHRCEEKDPRIFEPRWNVPGVPEDINGVLESERLEVTWMPIGEFQGQFGRPFGDETRRALLAAPVAREGERR